jgi:hypothetical protein
VQKDKDAALQFNDKILAIEPTDPTALKTKDALNSIKKPTTQEAPKEKPKGK